MRRALPWLLCVVAVAVIVAPMAQGTSSAKDPRVAGLITKVNGLQKQVNTLKAQFIVLDAKSSCLSAQGIILHGAAADEGYIYKKAAEATPMWLYSAFDAPHPGEAPQLYFATVAASCVTTSYRIGNGAAVGRTPALAHSTQAGR